MTTTPLEALAPYNVVAAASFNTVTDSTSLGLGIPPMIPSTTYSGSAPAVTVVLPRIRIVGFSPGWLLPLPTKTPLTLPCNILSTSLAVTSRSSSAFTTATDPEILPV
ncbi:hypothetical protein D3C80_1520680 [compost metagenome]